MTSTEKSMEYIEHRLLWSQRNESEHEAVMAECKRATEIGGTFQIKNEFTDNWYSVIIIYYPKESK